MHVIVFCLSFPIPGQHLDISQRGIDSSTGEIRLTRGTACWLAFLYHSLHCGYCLNALKFLKRFLRMGTIAHAFNVGQEAADESAGNLQKTNAELE